MIFTITLIIGSFSLDQAFAHVDPSGPNCTINGGDTSVTLLLNGFPVGSSVIQGQTIEMQITIEKGGGSNHCAVDGGDGAEPGLGTNATLPDNTLLQLDFGCIGGTKDGGDNIGPQDCAGSPAILNLTSINYIVDCADALEVSQNDFRLIWRQSTRAEYHDFVGDVNPSTLSKEDTIQKTCVIPQYSVNTTSSNTGIIDAVVSNPQDTVHIYGMDGIYGNWNTTAILSGPLGDLASTCILSPLVTNGTFPVDVICSLDAPIDISTSGTYCWDVTIEETSLVYGSNGNGQYLGSDDSRNECFTIPEDYTFVTTSSLTGVQQAPVNSPTDTVSITGVAGVEGNWTTDAILNLPVGGPLPATCTLSPLVTSGPFAADVTCALDAAPIELNDPGVYCWDVTVSESTTNYSIASDGTLLGSDDSRNECFTIPEDEGGWDRTIDHLLKRQMLYH